MAAGVRIPITYRLLRGEVAVDSATINTGKEVEGGRSMEDLPYWSKGLGGYRRGAEKTTRLEESGQKQ